MKIYIAGKITGMEEEAERLFQQAEDRLTEMGYEVVNPMKLPHDHDKQWLSYMIECLTALKECDAIFMLPNWMDSAGAGIEFTCAIRSKIIFLFSYSEAKILTENA